ncbi:Predicted Fe2+/Mn2+ transporter, VIT1/CCC1 family [Quadrisphaera granulorum]|uniref:VIT1/CCC1 family predicted Fe2+/Mn2+ transporter n=1 Tax=Quadrisphaera granulorum TaxID=317664 RepID=A0A315ZNK5_9ACTN|nr:VIT family protein [Quadrisphaera granulorum]PWJ47205.1 VIT1/CCC1 family predicted Fe2+/Mn2+ transporter [Quadrisphaera granulorum]SZE98891.1 Predicted Fe2+/Mn2+ transporter, VIT1/CCC1 family [Quadrisphaera granulorum]
MSTADATEPDLHQGVGDRLNWLRAGVLGANDGIVSVAGIVLGVLGATSDSGVLLTAGTAGLVAGALSMAVGEYVSVSTQKDTQNALLALERRELAEMPEQELVELAEIYEAKGIPADLAHQVAVALTERDALRAHAEAELNLDPDEVVKPWQAAWASMVSFTVGALLPLLAALLIPSPAQVVATVSAVLVALALTGAVSARLGGASVGRAVLRTMVGGAVAMAVTYGIGSLVGVAV